MANPFNFSSGDVLTAAELNSIGDWQSFTPTWNDLTIGNATNVGYYAEVNEIVYVTTKMVWGSTTSATDYFEMVVPVRAATDTQYQLGGNSILYNVGTALAIGTVNVFDSSGQSYAAPYGSYYSSGVGAYIYGGILNATSPFTWTTGDILYMNFWYRGVTIS